MNDLDLFPVPRTPSPDEKRSKYNPFMLALRLDNLPPATRPDHLTHVLSHPPSVHGRSKCKQETGVNLIQVYTAPKQSRTPKNGLGRILPVFGRSVTGYDKVHTAASSPRSSDEMVDQARPLLPRTIGPSSIEDGYRRDRTTAQAVYEARATVVGGQADDSPGGEHDVETYAMIHFRDEYWMYRAKHIFRRVTIDGRHIETKCKRWNGAALRRLWTRTEGQSD